jgi:hypothetical protein
LAFTLSFLPPICPFLSQIGEHHYFDIPSWGGPGGTITFTARDQKKKEHCATAGITLIHIPYW